MTSTMVRTFAVAAVAAAGAFAALGGGDALAGKPSNPFAGQYTGPMPDAYVQDAWGSISISSSGAIVGTQPPAGFSDGKFNGSVKADGTFEIVGSWNPNKFRNWVADVRPAAVETSAARATSPAGVAAGVIHYVQSAGTIALGADGNLYGTTTYGNSFVWRRQ